MLAIAILVLALALVFIGPPISRKGTTASHRSFSVTLPPDQVTIDQGQSPAGRKAQEVAEWRLCWLFAIPLAAPALFLIETPFYAVLAFLVAAMVFNAIVRLVTDSFDYVGHGVEIMVAEDEGEVGYREAEMKRMLLSKNRKGMTIAQVERKLAQWDWLARFARAVLSR